jgi:drug/metabolite transporter (DMT)-like permease
MSHTSQPLKLSTAAILTLPPLLWAGNAIVGRMVHDLISPFALNFLRWAIALLYLALKTSTPLNATLVGSSMPVWMLAVGRICWGIAVSRRQLLGAVLSVLGVAVVLSRGDPQVLRQLQLVPGDLFMVLATMLWAFYTWLLSRTTVSPQLRSDWSGFLLAQMVFGLMWSGLFTGLEAASGRFQLQPGWPLLGALLFIAIGPAILAYRFWGLGVQRSSPSVAGFFGNLMPLFTALLTIPLLGQTPQLYHGLAFALIVGGIMVSSRRG